MKLKYLVVIAALTGVATAAPEPGGPAAGRIPDWLDLDGDGVLSLEEREAFAESRRGAPDDLFHKWDTDQDGTVSDEERQIGIDALRAQVDAKRCELFLAVAGEEGELTLEEFSSVSPLDRMPEAVVGRLFNLLDGDGDGIVTKDEFLSAAGGGGRPSGPPTPPDPDDGE